MALDPNINRIKFLRSTVAGRKPTTAQISEGEIALNLTDRTIYTVSGGNVIDLGFGLGGAVKGNVDVTGTIKSTGAMSAPQFNGALNGNAASASKLLSGRKISLNGSATGSITFDGTSDQTITVNNNKLDPLDPYTKNGNQTPKEWPLGIQNLFVQATNNWPVSYGGLINFRPYTGSGGGALQVLTSYGASFGGNQLRYRLGDYNGDNQDAWTNWKILLDSDNFNAYVPKLNGEGATGNWNIAAKSLTDNQAGTLISDIVLPNSTWSRGSGSATDAPMQSAYKIFNMGPAAWNTQLYSPAYDNSLYVRTRKSNAGAFRPWSKVAFGNQAWLAYNGATTGWVKIATISIPQNGSSIKINVMGGRGFNSGNRSGNTCSTIILRAGNNNPKGLNAVYYIDDSVPGIASTAPAGVAFIDSSTTENPNNYDIIMLMGQFTSLQLNADYGEDSSVEFPATLSLLNANLPAGYTQAEIRTRALMTSSVASAKKLETPRAINGTNFDGSAPITTNIWGATRNLSIGKSTKGVNGGAAVSWSLAEMGAVDKAGDTMTGSLTVNGNITATKFIGPIGGNADSATKLQTARAINGVAFDGTRDIRIQQVAEGIPAGADLNTYISEGFFNCPQNVTAQTLKNTPFGAAPSTSMSAFSLRVEASAGVKQTLTVYASAGDRTWVRGIYQSTVSAWKEVAFTNSTNLTGTTTANRIDTKELNVTGGIANSGSFKSGNQTELGVIGQSAQVYIDFHSGASDNDYDTRIISSGGATAAGQGSLSYIANKGHTFTGEITAGSIKSATVGGAVGVGVLNTDIGKLAGVSLYGSTVPAGKPSYGITFAGTANATCGRHGDLDNALWAVYFTCATTGNEKRGWIFQGNNTNVASISTNGTATFNGNVVTTQDNTMIRVGNNADLGLIKKAGSGAFIAVGSNTPFRVLKSPVATVDPTQSYTELFWVTSDGIARSAGGFSGTFTGTFNGTISGTLTGSLNGNATTATTLQTARAIGITGSGASGSVSFNGGANVNIPLTVTTQATTTNNTTIATTAFVQNVNVAETGAAAYALKLKTPRTFQVTGGITTNAVAFDGQQNINLVANAVDGSKVSGVVPEAVKAQTVMVNGQPGARLAAMWSGTTWNRNFTRDAVYSSASSITIEIGDSNDGANDDRMNNIKVGSLLHLIFAVSTGGIWTGQLSTGTITAVTINRSTKSINLTVNIPHNISPGSKTSARILGITYSAIGCKYVGCVTLFAKGDIGDSEFSQLLQLDAPVNNAVMSTSVSGDVSRYHNLFPNGAFLLHRNASAMSATMVNNTMANFICTDNNNDQPASVGMMNIQIWDVV